MGCGRSRDVEAARDAPSEPPPLPDLAPMAELEALLAEAVRLGMLDRRGGAETRQRVVDGELALDAVRNTWREILGFDDAPLTGDEVEVSIRREHPVFEGARPRSGSLVASAHDDLTSASDDDSSDGDVAADGGEELLKNDVRRLSFLRTLTSRGRVQWDGTELSPPEGGWVPYAVLSCGKFGLGVFRPGLLGGVVAHALGVAAAHGLARRLAEEGAVRRRRRRLAVEDRRLAPVLGQLGLHLLAAPNVGLDALGLRVAGAVLRRGGPRARVVVPVHGERRLPPRLLPCHAAAHSSRPKPNDTLFHSAPTWACCPSPLAWAWHRAWLRSVRCFCSPAPQPSRRRSPSAS